MEDPLILSGREGLEFIVDGGSVGNVYSNIVTIENDVILALKEYFQELKKNGHYEEEVEIGSVWNKKKAKSHQIVVECSSKATSLEGFGKNRKPFYFIDNESSDSTTELEFQIVGGVYTVNCEISCSSTSRGSVSMLADAVLTGLNLDLANYLGNVDINIPANSIRISGKIQPVALVEGVNSFKITILIDGIITNYHQIIEVQGDILKNLGIYAKKLANIQ